VHAATYATYATYAIKTGMTVTDLADTWAPYLTMAESLRLNVRPRKAAPHLLLRLTPRPRRDRAGPTAPHRFGYDSTHHPLKETTADV